MKDIKNILFFLFTVLITLNSCEEIDDPLAGAAEVNNFVQFAADTPAEVTVNEGASSSITIQAPSSAGEDLLATISFSGDAVFGVDFDLSEASGATNVGGIVSKNATEAVIKIPFIPAGGADLITDQVKFNVVFLSDGVSDGDKTLIINLTGAVGSKTSSLVFDGGRGPIRVSSTISILDEDCAADVATLAGDYGVVELCPSSYTYSTTIAASTGNSLIIDNFGDWVGPGANQVTITVDPSTNNVTFPDTNIVGYPGESVYVSGSGKVVNTCITPEAQGIDITFAYYKQSDDSLVQDGCTHTYTPE